MIARHCSAKIEPLAGANTMLSHASHALPSLARNSPPFSRFVKIHLPQIHRSQTRQFRVRFSSERRPPTASNNRRTHSAAVTMSSPAPKPSTSKAGRKALRDSPEGILRHALDMCSKDRDLAGALALYDEARIAAVSLSQHHYNVLLYLCSNSDSEIGLARGFEILNEMVPNGVSPNEATFTSAARLAAAAEDPDKAFELVKQMKGLGIPPKLRSYGPALFGFCKNSDSDKAREVEAHMDECGVSPEEPELAALVKVNSEAGNGARVYRSLQRLRAAVRQVSEETAGVLEGWFGSEAAQRFGAEKWDPQTIKGGVSRGGGGWHGQGWLGTGEWKVERTEIDGEGVCRCCRERLVCIDIDPRETRNFAASLASLASKKEARSEFVGFQEWLKRHGPFDAVVDGANVGLVNQRDLNFFQLKSVLQQLREISPSKRMPLVILHRNRLNSGPALYPRNKQLLESWKNSGCLYPTPVGSNDDWYWLYAAVSNNCLLVTNDEMRDHLFQLLGTSFFPRWKEKHQVRLSVTSKGPSLHMPPTYSIVIQESENGRWHIPTVTGDDIEAPRQWLCATRAGITKNLR